MEFTDTQQTTFEYVSEVFANAVDNRHIWNVDYNEAKDKLNRLFYDSFRVVKDVYLRDFRNSDFPQNELEDFYYWLPSTHSALNTLKKLQKVVAKKGENDFTKKFEEVVNFFTPVIENMKASKEFIEKGRKPSENPRATPVRTLENTGTCSVCGTNVKLHNGYIVDHGFVVKWNTRSGKCPGVGYKPWEVSTDGAVAYIQSLTRSIDHNTSLLQKHMNDEIKEIFLMVREDGTNKKVLKTFTKEDGKIFTNSIKKTILNLQSEVSWQNIVKTDFEKRVNGWKPGVLPG